MLELLAEAEDPEALRELEDSLVRCDRDIRSLELNHMLGGENDRNNAILSVNAGAGGTDSCDWAEMLFRMYRRWSERRGFRVRLLDQQPGDGAGIRSSTMIIEGPFAYGYAKAETGVHRLVRISPFDSNKRRHTSFASVFVSPELDDSIEV